MTPAMYSEMRASPDVTVKSSKLVSVNKLEVDGNMAYAVYVTHACFDFKGTVNDDIAVYTGVFQKGGEVSEFDPLLYLSCKDEWNGMTDRGILCIWT